MIQYRETFIEPVVECKGVAGGHPVNDLGVGKLGGRCRKDVSQGLFEGR